MRIKLTDARNVPGIGVVAAGDTVNVTDAMGMQFVDAGWAIDADRGYPTIPQPVEVVRLTAGQYTRAGGAAAFANRLLMVDGVLGYSDGISTAEFPAGFTAVSSTEANRHPTTLLYNGTALGDPARAVFGLDGYDDPVFLVGGVDASNTVVVLTTLDGVIWSYPSLTNFDTSAVVAQSATVGLTVPGRYVLTAPARIAGVKVVRLTSNAASVGVVLNPDQTPVTIIDAALGSSAATAAGIGVGSTLQGSPTIDFSAGGAKRTSAGTGYISIPIPSTYAACLIQQGTLSFEICRSDLANFTSNATQNNLPFLQLTDAGIAARGFDARTFVDDTGDTTTSYRCYTESKGGVIYPNAIGITSGSVWAITETPQVILHNATDTQPGSDYIKVEAAWNPISMTWYVNDIPVVVQRHKTNITGIADRLAVQRSIGIRMRNIKLTLAEKENPAALKAGRKTIVACMHSYGTTACGLAHLDRSNVFWTGLPPMFGSDDNILSAMFKNLAEPCAIVNVSYGSRNLSWMQDMIASRLPYAFIAPATNTVTAGSCVGTTATLTIGVGHTLQPGDPVTIAGMTPAGYNATNKRLTAVDPAAGTVSYTVASTQTAATVMGTVALESDDRVHRFRPAFVVVGGSFNDQITAVATIKASVTAINTALVAAGIVPIWLQEQNGNLGTPVSDRSANGTGVAIGEQVVADRLTMGDIGLADLWAQSGGASVNPLWCENTASGYHGTLLAQRQYGVALAGEVNRLLASPPAYAWWR